MLSCEQLTVRADQSDFTILENVNAVFPAKSLNALAGEDLAHWLEKWAKRRAVKIPLPRMGDVSWLPSEWLAAAVLGLHMAEGAVMVWFGCRRRQWEN